MENDQSKQRSRQKRRERALHLQEKQSKEEEEEEASGIENHDESPPRSSKDSKSRSKPKKVKNALFEEDIIDGFAIMSFKTFEDLESLVKKKNGCIQENYKGDDSKPCLNDSTDAIKEENGQIRKKKNKKNVNIDNKNNKKQTSQANGNNNSILNSNNNNSNAPLEPPRCISRDRLSDVSHSSSGQGYVCDVESGDDKISESGSDFFSGIPGLLNHIPVNGPVVPCVGLTAPTPPPSTSSTPTPLCTESTPSPHQQLNGLATTTTTGTSTNTTSTSSQSRPGFKVEPSSSSTSLCPLVTSIPSQSVILSAPSYLPTSSAPPSFQTSRLPDADSPKNCARSIQYSKHAKSHKDSFHNSIPPKENHSSLSQQVSPNQNYQFHNGNASFYSHSLLHSHQQQPSPNRIAALNSNQFKPVHQNSLLYYPAHNFPVNSHQAKGTPSDLSGKPELRESSINKKLHPDTQFKQLANGVHIPTTSTIVANNLVKDDKSSDKSTQGHIAHRQLHPYQHSFTDKHNIQPHQNHHNHNHHHPYKHSSSNHHHHKSPTRTPPIYSTPSSQDLRKTSPLTISRSSSRTPTGRDSVSSLGKDSKDRSKREECRSQDKDRSRERSSSSSSLTPNYPPVPGIGLPGLAKPTVLQGPPSVLYGPFLSPVQQSPLTPSSLHPLASPTVSVASPLVPPQSAPLLPHPLAPSTSLLTPGAAPSLSTGMFAPPIPPAPPTLSTAGAAPPLPGPDGLIRSQQDFLHQDLNNRLLAHRDSNSIGLTPSPFARSETHQHQHQHLHNHMHQHTYGGLGNSPIVPPAVPPLFDKLPKAFDGHVFRPSLLPNYNATAAFSSLLPAGPSTGVALSSSLQGAFQPKNLLGTGPVQTPMLVPYRDREKSGPQPATPTSQKKQGRWCAAHVKVAWDIYSRQQKQDGNTTTSSTSSTTSSQPKPGSSSSSSSSSSDSKPLEPLLRPPSHLTPSFVAPSLVSRAHEIGAPPSAASLLAPGGRNSLPENLTHPGSSYLSPSQLGVHPFPRPAPYPPPSLLNPLGFSGLGSSMFGPGREALPPHSIPSSASPHDWQRLQRAPASFPSWPKAEVDREKEREREIRKTEERERERQASLAHRIPGMDTHRPKDGESSRPRSRSRSPLRNGRIDHVTKLEPNPLDRRFDDKPSVLPSTPSVGLNLKLNEDKRDEERLVSSHLDRERLERDRLDRERSEREKLIHMEREKLLQTSSYLALGAAFPGAAPPHPILDRQLGLTAAPTAYPFLDRPPVPTSLWSPLDKSPIDLAHHRLEWERERERLAMMARLSGVPQHLAALEQERLKEHLLREQHEREMEVRRQYLDRLPVLSADRLRAVDPLAMGYFPRTVSPLFGLGAAKSGSPAGLPGVPPPLIPSSSSVGLPPPASRNHDNSPSSSSKPKGCSPADSTSDIKDKREAGSVEQDTHSR